MPKGRKLVTPVTTFQFIAYPCGKSTTNLTGEPQDSRMRLHAKSCKICAGRSGVKEIKNICSNGLTYDQSHEALLENLISTTLEQKLIMNEKLNSGVVYNS